MNQSFYTAAIGAGGFQAKMDVVGNNFANVNTYGFKEQYGVFSDLMYTDVRSTEGGSAARAGKGIRLEQVKTNFDPNGLRETGLPYDYAIEGEGFFMLQDPGTGEISYTRDGRFHLSRQEEDIFYLAADDGRRVLNMDQEAITYDVEEARKPGDDIEEDEEEEEELDEDEHDPKAVGVFTFTTRDGMINSGNNEYKVTEKHGEPILLEKAKVRKGFLENSGVNFAKEMTRMMEAQRAYSYSLKMVQTSDEIESTINGLR